MVKSKIHTIQQMELARQGYQDGGGGGGQTKARGLSKAYPVTYTIMSLR